MFKCRELLVQFRRAFAHLPRYSSRSSKIGTVPPGCECSNPRRSLLFHAHASGNHLHDSIVKRFWKTIATRSTGSQPFYRVFDRSQSRQCSSCKRSLRAFMINASVNGNGIRRPPGFMFARLNFRRSNNFPNFPSAIRHDRSRRPATSIDVIECHDKSFRSRQIDRRLDGVRPFYELNNVACRKENNDLTS